MKKTYWTKINGNDETFGMNADYVRGRISGFLEVLCGKNTRPNYFDPDTGITHMAVSCTEEQYRVFRELVEKRYPNLCEFDVNFEE